MNHLYTQGVNVVLFRTIFCCLAFDVYSFVIVELHFEFVITHFY